MDQITLRPLQVTDSAAFAQLFFDAVHKGTTAEYTAEQRAAWAGDAPNEAGWTERFTGLEGVVAEIDGQMAGLMTIDADGYVFLAYVRHDLHGRGVGRLLYDTVEAQARTHGATRMTTEASLKARPFFERFGWTVDAQQTVTRRGVDLTNFRMSKPL